VLPESIENDNAGIKGGFVRRFVTFNWMSADGFFSGQNDDLSWVVPDSEQRRRAAKDIAQFDTSIFGRKTYELFSQFWTHALDDSLTAFHPYRPGQRTEEHHAVAVALNAMTKLVFSTTLEDATWNNSRVIRNLDPVELAEMKRRPGKDIIVFGSGSIATQLTAHALIDEYQFVVCPTFLGQGRPFLSALHQSVALELAEAQP
jgi:dihydrofolate reductase